MYNVQYKNEKKKMKMIKQKLNLEEFKSRVFPNICKPKFTKYKYKRFNLLNSTVND